MSCVSIAVELSSLHVCLYEKNTKLLWVSMDGACKHDQALASVKLSGKSKKKGNLK